MKVTVNQNVCISCGMCIDVCPEVFDYDDDFKSKVIQDSISDNLKEKSIEAKNVCPVDAIEICE